MARDLGIRSRIVGCPTVREADGLAVSSRNAYLSPEERSLAPAIRRALLRVAREALGGAVPTPGRVVALARRELRRIPGSRLDYAGLADAATLEEPVRLEGRLRLLAAVRLGRARLIDNIPLSC